MPLNLDKPFETDKTKRNEPDELKTFAAIGRPEIVAQLVVLITNGQRTFVGSHPWVLTECRAC